MGLKQEIDKVIADLERQGVNSNTHYHTTVGLGDVIETTLQKFGVTEERFKNWFGLKECKCKKRKQWLNGVLSWKMRN